MSKSPRWMKLVLAAGLACAVLISPQVIRAQSFSDQQKPELGGIIREYLVSHPEVLQEAMAELEKRQTLAEAEKNKAAVKSNAATLFDSTHQVVVGNPQGDVTLVEFFDYNCGYCKRALSDMIDLLKDDGKGDPTFGSADWDPAVGKSPKWSVSLPAEVFSGDDFVTTRVGDWTVAALKTR